MNYLLFVVCISVLSITGPVIFPVDYPISLFPSNTEIHKALCVKDQRVTALGCVGLTVGLHETVLGAQELPLAMAMVWPDEHG